MEAVHEGRGLRARLLLKFGQDAFMESRDDLVSMLYYLGFLTIGEASGGQAMLRIPNRLLSCII